MKNLNAPTIIVTQYRDLLDEVDRLNSALALLEMGIAENSDLARDLCGILVGYGCDLLEKHRAYLDDMRSDLEEGPA